MIDPDFIGKLDDIHQDIKKNGDVLTVPMKRLKTLHGAERLKSLVRQSIQDHLSYRQIGFVGQELPASENESVRLYLKGTPVARIIETVPGATNNCESSPVPVRPLRLRTWSRS